MPQPTRERKIQAAAFVFLNAATALVLFKLADFHPRNSGAFAGCVLMGVIFGVAAIVALGILYNEFFFKDD